MKLSDIKFNDIQVGLKVKSLKGLLGKIVQKVNPSTHETTKHSREKIEISWEDGEVSIRPLNECEDVEVVLTKSQVVE
jgi:hypothetical protein